MPRTKNNFDLEAFLAAIGQGRKIVRVRKEKQGIRARLCLRYNLLHQEGQNKTTRVGVAPRASGEGRPQSCHKAFCSVQ